MDVSQLGWIDSPLHHRTINDEEVAFFRFGMVGCGHVTEHWYIIAPKKLVVVNGRVLEEGDVIRVNGNKYRAHETPRGVLCITAGKISLITAKGVAIRTLEDVIRFVEQGGS